MVLRARLCAPPNHGARTMSMMNLRRLGLAAITGAALALAGCATPFKADVARFQSQLPAPQGQSFVVEASDPALQGGIEFRQYANIVAGELTRYGYRPAANGERADLVVRMGSIGRGSLRAKVGQSG